MTAADSVTVRDGSRYGQQRPASGSACVLCAQPCPSPRAHYCSEACKQRAYRLRQAAPVDTRQLAAALRAQRHLVDQTVYECPACEQRYLGTQRCAECQLFCRSLGLGGTCPDCDRIILLDELLGRA